MFNLEQSIAEWRRQMLAAGIKTPVPLEELEIHLREEIEQQMKSGLNEQEAFNSAVQKIGQEKALKSEFQKIGGIFENTIMKKYKPVIYVGSTHYLLWWTLFGVLSLPLPHFGFNSMFDGGFFGGKPEHPFLDALSDYFWLPLNVLSFPMMWLWDWPDSHNWFRWLGWLFAPPLNSLIWGGIFGGLWITVRQKFNRLAVSRN
jgi:hypothetical protein